jgi:hypothetical protein
VKSGFFTSNRIISGWPTRPVHTFTFKELSGTIIARTMTLATTRLHLHALRYSQKSAYCRILGFGFAGCGHRRGYGLAVPD